MQFFNEGKMLNPDKNNIQYSCIFTLEHRKLLRIHRWSDVVFTLICCLSACLQLLPCWTRAVYLVCLTLKGTSPLVLLPLLQLLLLPSHQFINITFGWPSESSSWCTDAFWTFAYITPSLPHPPPPDISGSAYLSSTPLWDVEPNFLSYK